MRWQYAIASVGMFGTAERLQTVFGRLGEDGWELVNVYDKSSNWFNGMEKGFAMFKRPVAPGDDPVGGWAVQVGRDGAVIAEEVPPDVPW